MHCYIAWHTLEGLAMQLLEREDEFASLMDSDALNFTCAALDAFSVEQDITQLTPEY
jgi:hypothetical protein